MDDVEQIPTWRRPAFAPGSAENLLVGRRIEHEDVLTSDAADAVVIAVFRAAGRVGPAPAIFYIHGGGMVSGDRFGILPDHLDWVERLGVVLLSVEYRLAPEHPYPAQVDDCRAGLVWVVEHADDLGIDPGRLLVSGGSAGGGIAAAVTLTIRERGGPRLAGQLLESPMLDDRAATISARQFPGTGLWRASDNRIGWRALLGERAGTDDVSPFAAPGRASDLRDLPPTFIDVGSAEVLRDEAVEFATRIWVAGGSAELHVWAGGYHGFEHTAPAAAISIAARQARQSWIRRVLGV